MFPDDGDDGLRRFRCLTHLIADPDIDAYKHAAADDGSLSWAARRVLERRAREISDRAWACIAAKYGVRRGTAFCAVYSSSSPLCMLTLTTNARDALEAATTWVGVAGPAGVEIAVVRDSVATVFAVKDTRGTLSDKRRDTSRLCPERYVTMAAALSYCRE